MDKCIKFKSFARILTSFGVSVSDGKGSEKKLFDPRTRKISCVKHHGANPEVARQVVASVRRKFELDSEHGVSDEDFYGRA